MELKVTKVENGAYGELKIQGEGVDITAKQVEHWWLAGMFSAKLTGKGARKVEKEVIRQAIEKFYREEGEKRDREYELRAKRWYEHHNATIEDKTLYSVTYFDTHEKKEVTALIVGHQLKEIYWQVFKHEAVEVKDSDFYGLGRFIASGQRTAERVRDDARYMVICNGIRVTGKTLKEMIEAGEHFYTLYRDNRRVMHVVEEAHKFAKGEIKSLLGAIGEEKVIAGVNMWERVVKEMERAGEDAYQLVKDAENYRVKFKASLREQVRG